MTENEVLKNLTSCIAGDCNSCSYACECSDNQILKDAKAIIQLQKNQLEMAIKRNDELNEANKSLQQIAKVNYTEQQLIQSVNRIIEAFTDDEDEYSFGARIDAVQDFMKTVNYKGLVCIHKDGSIEIRKL